MFFSKKRLTLMLSIACFFISVIEYIPYHIFLNTDSAAAKIIYLLISNAVELLLPVLFATMLLARSGDFSRGGMLLSCLCLSIPRIGFYAPYFYMEIFGLGFDSGVTILLSLLIALAFAIGFGVLILLLYGASVFAYNKEVKKYGKTRAISLSDMLNDGDVFDFSRPRAKIIAPSVIIAFILSLPIYSVVEFFVSYGGSFIFEEILYIILEVLYLLGIFVFGHFLAVRFAGAVANDK